MDFLEIYNKEEERLIELQSTREVTNLDMSIIERTKEEAFNLLLSIYKIKAKGEEAPEDLIKEINRIAYFYANYSIILEKRKIRTANNKRTYEVMGHFVEVGNYFDGMTVGGINNFLSGCYAHIREHQSNFYLAVKTLEQKKLEYEKIEILYNPAEFCLFPPDPALEPNRELLIYN